ncbi:Deoxyhypusine synthase [Dictyocoela muelleri]|nr:Deoxyhypusine synthase [Dictyocoela muelleri]
MSFNDFEETREKLEKIISNWPIINIFENSLFEGEKLNNAIAEVKKMKNSKVFLSFTENILSPLNKAIIIELIKRKKIHVIVTTPGVIETELCFDNNEKNNENKIPQFNSVPDNILEKIDFNTTSEFLRKIGGFINKNTILHQAYKHSVNIYCPTILDGNIKLPIKYKMDIVSDIRNMNGEAMFEKSTGALVCGTGIVKHHILNANLFKNGLNYCVLLNSAIEYDGSDAGASIEEAVSWGKIVPDSSSVKVKCDPNISFPLVAISGFLID